MEQVHQQRFTEQESQHDACGIGAVVNISGQRTHRAVDDALKIVEKLEHRTGKDADGTTGLRRRHDLFSAGSAQTYAQPKAAGDDPVARRAEAAVLAGCAGLSGDSERKSAEQYACNRAVLYPPPGKDRARPGF